MGYGRAIATNTLWTIIGKVLTTALALVVTGALARALGVVGFGEYTIAFAYLSFFGVIADFGFFQILVRELSREKADQAAVTSNIFTLRTLFALIVYLIAAGAIWLFPYSFAVQQAVIVLAAASLLLSINTTMIGVFTAHHQMYKAVIGDVIGRIVLVAIVLWAVAQGWSLPMIMGAYLVANAINLLVTFSYLIRLVPLQLTIDWPLWKRYAQAALPLGVVTVLSIIYFKIDSLLLSVLKPAADVGIYGAPYKIFELLTIVPAIFMGNVLPVIMRLMHHKERFYRLVQSVLHVIIVLAIGMTFGLVGVAHGVIGLVAGGEFQTASTLTVWGQPVTAVHILGILSFALISIFFGQLWGSFMIALDKQRALIGAGLVGVVLNIGLNLLFIPQWSYLAAAVTTLITETYIAFHWGSIARRFLPVSIRWSVVGWSLIAGLVMLAAIWPLRDLSLAVPIGVGAVVYGALLWLFGVIKPEMLHYLSSDKE